LQQPNTLKKNCEHEISVVDRGMNEDVPSDAKDSAVSGGKPAWYYDTHDHDIVNLLPTNSKSAVLELGCGSGVTGRKALGIGKAGRYVGIEIDQASARIAETFLSEVLVGNIETLDLTSYREMFDALVASEVLEHLIDPWTALRKLRTCLKPGAVVIASSPNIAHWQIIRALLKGQFRYTEYGVMDSTHLRWFTPESYKDMFIDAGFAVETLRPVREMGWKAKAFNAATDGRFSHLLIKQIMVIAHR
jgi:2-polyprenyl-3-methyl-5-hydroxy-6-metoxy-1,4-benzoquinol methylase